MQYFTLSTRHRDTLGNPDMNDAFVALSLAAPWYATSADGQPVVLRWATSTDLARDGWADCLEHLVSYNNFEDLSVYERCMVLHISFFAALQLEQGVGVGKPTGKHGRAFKAALSTLVTALEGAF